MKFSAIICSAVIVCAVTAAVAATNYGPAVIDLKMGKNVIKFQHKTHQDKLNNECEHCHKTELGKIDGWDEDRAHVICIACHDLYDKGPTECKGCHAK